MGNTKTFTDIKNEYINARIEQRCSLKAVLKENGYNVTKRGGIGRANYKSGKNKLNPPHNLKHHQWIETSKNHVNILISLNPFDMDTNSGNPHHLYDRIGVQAYLNDNTEQDIRTSMIITRWSLPLSKLEQEELLHFLNKLVKWFEEWK